MTTETRKRREYTEDFKRDAVALVTDQGYKVSEAARSLGIGEGLVRLRHFYRTGQKAGLHEQDMESIFSDLTSRMEDALAEATAMAADAGKPESTSGSILAGVSKRARIINARVE